MAGAGLVRWCTGNKGWWTLSYLVDWLLCGAVFLCNIAFAQYWLKPSDRYLPENFQIVQYPRQPEVLPTWLVILLTVVLPVAIFLVFQIALRSGHDFHHACLGLFETFTFNLVFCSSIQYLSGKYTPDWYERLRTGTPTVIKDGRLSYPSWHSATTFASLGYFSFYLAGKLGIFRKNSGHSWKALIVLVPLYGAALVAVTRTLDYHNDFDDITAGALLGLCMAKFFYTCNFHDISSNRSHLPLNRNNTSLKRAIPRGTDSVHERLPVRLDHEANDITDDERDEQDNNY